MQHELTQVYEVVRKLSAKINKIYKIEPEIRIRVSANFVLPHTGLCQANSQVPWWIVIDVGEEGNNLEEIKLVLLHEYCHYIEAIGCSPTMLRKMNALYLAVSMVRVWDERRTWQHTKQLAKDLGVWSKRSKKTLLRQWAYTNKVK